MFIVLIGSIATTCIAWFLIHTYYAPYHLPAYLTFLSPRTWRWIADIPTGPFHQWTALPVVIIVYFGCIYLGYRLAISKNVSFKTFSLLLYLLCLLSVTAFLFLTPNGIGHIALQAKSVMNVIWLPLHYLNNILPGFNELSVLDKIKYIFTVPGATHAIPTYDGSTHPPMFTLIGFAFYFIAKFLFTPLQGTLTAHGVHYIAFGWGIIVTFINATLIILTASIARILFSEKIGRLTGVLFLTMPSVVFYICAVMEGVPTVILASGILILLTTIKVFSEKKPFSVRRSIFYGLVTGVCFTTAAQFSYGFAIPIGAFLIAFLICAFPLNRRLLSLFLSGMSMPAVLYFIFEYFISSGQSFWITRSIFVTNWLNLLMSGFRPYPMSQAANFVVMSVMGGILWLPLASATTVSWIRFLVKKLKRVQQPKLQPSILVQFFTLGVSIYFIYLILQTAVRLEVERTWFWAFFPVWTLAGLYYNPFVKRFRKIKNPALILMILQAIISLILATQVQDYY